MPSSARARLGKKLTGFGVLHAANTASNLVYTLLQMLIFARMLEPQRYAEIIVLTSIGLYLQPISQATGRSSYVTLRDLAVRDALNERRDDISAVLTGQMALMLVISVAAPLFLSHRGPVAYLENALFLASVLFANFWSFNMQPVAWSVDLNRPFANLSLVRRAVHFLALLAGWLTQSLLVFGVLTAIAIIVFQVLARRDFARRTDALPAVPRWSLIDREKLKSQLRQFRSSFLNALSELIILNSPYGLLTFLFGVGPVVVVYDTVMKLTRLTMAGSRTIAEIFLARFTRALIEGRRGDAMRAATVAGGVCVVLSLVPAVIVAFAGPLVFSLLLGQNNVVPPEASLAAAAIIAISGIYQPTALFLSYGNYEQGIRRFTLLCSVALAVFVAVVVTLMPPITQIIWIYAVFFGLCACFSAWLSFEMIRRVPAPS